jgi:hypothetical protein
VRWATSHAVRSRSSLPTSRDQPELVRRLGTRYADTLGEHRQLVRASFADHERWEIDTQGDAFFVAFDRVRDAVLCAADIQRSLATHASAANLSQSSLEGEDLGNLEPRESKHIFPLTPSEPRILRPGRRRRRSCPSTSSSFRDFHPDYQGSANGNASSSHPRRK